MLNRPSFSLILLIAGACAVDTGDPSAVDPLCPTSTEVAYEACEAERLELIEQAQTIWEYAEAERAVADCRASLHSDPCLAECERAAYLCATYRATELARGGPVLTTGCSSKRDTCRETCEAQ